MKKYFFCFIFCLAFLERTVWDLGPNIELITLSMILAAAYRSRGAGFWLTFLTLALSDFVIGNTNIFLFTWSGFLIPFFLASAFFQSFKRRGLGKVLAGTMTGIGANFFFYLWTNFGVWILDSWGMYEQSLAGLVTCFINGLPFLKMQLTSTLIFIPMVFTIFEVALQLKHGRLCRRYQEINLSQ